MTVLRYYNANTATWDPAVLGPQGATGATGAASNVEGPTGATGATGAGATGATGIEGPTGATGPAGTIGVDGSTGATGSQGATGATGPIAGSNTQVIFNDAGVAGADANLTYDKTTAMLSVTGNATVTGTGSNLIRRGYGNVAAGVAVTLDNIEASINSGTSQLMIYLNSGTWQATGISETFQGGGPTINYWVNIPISQTGSPNGFAMSGAMNNQSNGCCLTFSDQDNLDKMYRVTVLRAGTSGNLWTISIERLV